MNTLNDPDKLREEEYQLRLKVKQLRQAIYQNPGLLPSQDLLDRLKQAEQDLSTIEQERTKAQAADPQSSGVIIDTKKRIGTLGPQTTGLEVHVQLRMAQVPTAIYHLLDPVDYPLITCSVRNVKKDKITRRVRVISYIDGYSAQAVDTVELEPTDHHEFNQHPTLFPDRLQNVTELTRASLNIMLEDMDRKLELHKTYPIWLLPKNAAYMQIWGPQEHKWKDMSRYLGAFVTPNAPPLMEFLRSAAEYHPQKSFLGYQGDEKRIDPQKIVDPQVKAIFTALKEDAMITYVNSLTAFNPDEDINLQRVRLPRESLKDRQANCIDGTVLFASLLEGITLSPAIVLVPGHAFVAWETWGGYNKWSNEWKYLETTMIRGFSFEEACNYAQHLANHHKQEAEKTKDPSKFIFLPLRVLRSSYIVPME